MKDTGWVNPATADTTQGLAQTAFSGPNAIKLEDGIPATTSQAKFDDGQFPEDGVTLKATNFSFGIPTGATILGIETYIKGTCSNVGNMAYLGVTGGSPILPLGVQKEYHWLPPESGIASAQEPFIFGSPTDLWGTIDLSPATVNSVDFGWVWMLWDSANPLSASIDTMQMKIYYEEQAGAAMLGAGF